MTEIRALVITRRQSDLAIDHCVNTLHFDTDSPFTWPAVAGSSLDELQLAKDLRDVFRARAAQPNGYGTEVKMYDLADAIPRPVRGHAVWQPATGVGQGDPGPREVALCLSTRGEVNTKRTRGRIYIGPWTKNAMVERPDSTTRTGLTTLATAIGNVGGIDIDWCVRSTVTNDQVPVKHAYVDDEWDTMRSRGYKPTTRSTVTLNE